MTLERTPSRIVQGESGAPDAPPSSVGRLRLGCAVWAYEGWRGGFFPKRARKEDMLALYGERLTAVELNASFYAIPSSEQLERWAAKTPADFRFCPKLHRDYTHAGPLMTGLEGARAFARRMRALEGRLGPQFVQLPQTYTPRSGDDLETFLRSDPTDGAPLALELRHADWYHGGVRARLFALLEELGLARVVLDVRAIYETGGPPVPQERRKPHVPFEPRATGPLAFIRFVGHPDLARNDPFLDEWAERVESELARGRDVYFFAHCPVEDHSPGIARELYERLAARGVEAQLPWEAVEAEPEQLDLF